MGILLMVGKPIWCDAAKIRPCSGPPRAEQVPINGFPRLQRSNRASGRSFQNHGRGSSNPLQNPEGP